MVSGIQEVDNSGMRSLRGSASFCLIVPALGLTRMIRRTLTMILIEYPKEKAVGALRQKQKVLSSYAMNQAQHSCMCTFPTKMVSTTVFQFSTC